MRRCKEDSQFKGEEEAAGLLYSRGESQDPVTTRQDLRPSALAQLQDPKKRHTPRPAMSRTYWNALKETHRDQRRAGSARLDAAWFAPIRVDGFVECLRGRPGRWLGGLGVCSVGQSARAAAVLDACSH